MKSQSLMTTAALGIMAGLFISKFEPQMGYLLMGASSLLLLMELRTLSPMRTLFRNLGLVNKDGVYPQQTEKNIIAGKITYCFSLPAGLGLEDFEKNRGRMQDYLGKRVSIKCEAKKVILEVSD